jgi:hypothetical protein
MAFQITNYCVPNGQRKLLQSSNKKGQKRIIKGPNHNNKLFGKSRIGMSNCLAERMQKKNRNGSRIQHFY